MARSMLSHGMFSALAASMAVRRRGFPAGSPPPCRAAMVISRISLVKAAPRLASRSEEHTSELQSRLHLVCRLLLEKKKNRLSVGEYGGNDVHVQGVARCDGC